MDINEANKVIAEYMGFEFDEATEKVVMWHTNNGYMEYIPYSASLDSLVPVWEKLRGAGNHGFSFVLDNRFPRICCAYRNHNDYKLKPFYGDIAQEAACIATATAIKELN